MDWKRLKDPSFVAAAASCVVLIVLLFSRCGSSPSTTPVPAQPVDFRPQLSELHAAIDKTSTRLADLEKTLQKVETLLADSTEGDPADPGLELHTKTDADKLVLAIGETPSAKQLADCLGEIDGWIAAAEEQDALQSFKVQQVDKLRALVKKELADLHDKALMAQTGNEAGELHAQASQILGLYPIDTSQKVLDEARQISSRHAEVGVRIDVIRRQRYNAWAMTRIEETIKAINEIATSFKTSDNPKTIKATVDNLGAVDPLLLEPVVAQLYNYAVEQAKANVNSEQQLELGRRMIDPTIKRKGYGDF